MLQTIRSVATAFNAYLYGYVACVSHIHSDYTLQQKMSITSNILSKNTINRINFHQDLWMLCDVSFFVTKKLKKKKKKNWKSTTRIELLRLTTYNIQSNIVECFSFQKVHIIYSDKRCCQQHCAIFSITFFVYLVAFIGYFDTVTKLEQIESLYVVG